MAYQKRYRTVIPLPRDQTDQDTTLVWLTAESFYRKALGDSLVIVEFDDEGEMPADDVPPKAAEQLGKPAGDFVWRVFEGTGARP